MEKYCPKCRSIIKDPYTSNIHNYAKYWRDNQCYICNTKLIDRNLIIEQSPTEVYNHKMEGRKYLKYVGIIIFVFIVSVFLINFVAKKVVSNQAGNLRSDQYEDKSRNQYEYNKPYNLFLTINEIKEKAISISYEELYRYNESYIHQIIYIKGKIVQTFQSYGNTTGFRIATKRDYYDYYDNIIYVDYDSSTRLMENDYVEVWSEVIGLITYTTVLGSELTIPHLYSLHSNLLNTNNY